MDLQFLPYNRRTAEVITPLIVQRMMPGGTLSTDCWRAYRAATAAVDVPHLTVNHSETFRDPDTGVHTNNVEGIHAVIKKDARRQFGRLPYLTAEGQSYYLDLLVWRTNTKLKKAEIMKSFCVALWRWTKDPLKDWNHTTPVWNEDDDASDEEDVELEEEDDESDEDYDLRVPRDDDEDDTAADEDDFEFEDV